MKITTLDFETAWSHDYSLSIMTPLEYITDPRFELQFCEMCIDGEEPEFLVGEDMMRQRFARIDWSKVAALGHNMSGFDALIMAIIFKIKPAMWLCTLAMARPIYSKTIGLSLKKLVEELLPGEVKDNTVLLQTKGKRLADFTEDEIRRMKIYNGADTRQCRMIFAILRKHFTVEELWQIDCLIRMRTEPEFVVDVPLLEDALEKVRAEKIASLNRLIEALGLSLDTTVEQVRAQLASAPKFAQLLTSLGVEVPTKPSKTNPDKRIPALAKTDEQFIELVEHENELVATAARCRLEVKSTGLEARLEAHLNAGARSGGLLPIPIKYCGADTSGRDSGEEYNPQNMPRIGKVPKNSDAVRRSLKAPEGHVVAVADQSGIELRVNHFLWKEPQSMAAYQADVMADLYRAFAARYYGVPESEIGKGDPRRQAGKVFQLQLGFGAGSETLRSVASVQYGVDLPMHYAHLDGRAATAMNERQALALELDGFKRTKDEAKDAVYGWRGDYTRIVEGWSRCNDSLRYIAQGRKFEVDPWGLVKTCAEGFVLPSGRLIRYPHLRYLDEAGVIEEFFNGERPDSHDSVKSRTGWWYGRGRHRARIYGGKADENCLAGGTIVLTNSGWKVIEKVTAADLVHDGVEFVRHGGAIYKSVQECVSVDGVYMTPDHEVLTNEGWQAASQNPQPHRPDIRHVDGRQPGVQRRQEAPMVLPMQLRETLCQAGCGCDKRDQAGWNTQLWVRNTQADFQVEPVAWNVPPPSLFSVQVDAGQVLATNASSLEKLRRAWDTGLRSLGRVVRKLLGGHGSVLPAGVDAGASSERGRILQGELCVGDARSSGAQSEDFDCRDRHSRDVQADRNQQVDPVLQAAPRTAAREVYDILDAGPRQRFVVLGDSGPFVVHNCVQALARDSIFDCSVAFYRLTGYRPKLRVHDELVYIFPDTKAKLLLTQLQTIIRTPPKWWPELIVWSEGDIAACYGDAK